MSEAKSSDITRALSVIWQWIKGFLSKNAMLVVLVLVMVLFEFLMSNTGRGSLFSPQNLTNLIRQNSYVVILATGMLLCILTGGNIDLSVGSVVVLVAAVSGILIVNNGVNIYLAIIICLLFGTLIGAWQAFWIAYVRVPPFVTTLAGMLIFRGIALLLLGAQGISPYPDNYLVLFQSFLPSEGSTSAAFTLSFSVITAVVVLVIFAALQIFSRINKKRKGYSLEHIAWMVIRIAVISGVVLFVFSKLGEHRGIPVILIWLGVIVLVYNYFTQNTIPGRYLYAMGGNEKAARLSGINTKRMMFFAYTNMGFLSGVTALVCVARFGQAGTTLGTGFELDAIGACFIGGASAYGGIGKVGGAVIGAIFMGVLNMGMSIMGVDVNMQRVIKGSVLLAAVIFDVLSKNKKQAA